MVKITMMIDRGKELREEIVNTLSATNALESMVYRWLNVGFVKELSLTRVVIAENRGFNFKSEDIIILEGSKEEMELIVKVAAHHAALMNDKMDQNPLVKQAIDFLSALSHSKEASDKPPYIKIMAAFLKGRSSVSAALIFAAGITDPEIIKTLAPLDPASLIIAVERYPKAAAPLPETAQKQNTEPAAPETNPASA